MAYSRWIGAAALAVLAATAAFAAPSAGGAARSVLPAMDDESAWSVTGIRSNEVAVAPERQLSPVVLSAHVLKVDGVDWHTVILDVKPIRLADGHRYTLTLLARADTTRNIRAIAFKAPDFKQTVGLDETLPIGFPYTSFRKSFVAKNPTGAACQFAVAVGATTGRVWVEDISLVDDGPANAVSPATT